VYYNAGLTAFQGGDLPGAARFLREATRLRPAYPPAWYLLGGVLNDLGDREASVQAWVLAARQGSVEAQTVLRQRGVRW
jgi:Flp pilus assembly protein TadD